MGERTGDKRKGFGNPRESGEGRSRRTLLRAGLGIGVTGSLTGCQSLIPRALSEAGNADSDNSETDRSSDFAEDWSDGSFDGWVEYEATGDADVTVRQMTTPSGGSWVMSVSQSAGGGTESIVGTQSGFEGWDEPWRLTTVFHTTALDPSVSHQSYELVPGHFIDDADEPRLTFYAGVRDGEGTVRPAEFDGVGIESNRNFVLDWASDRWYHVELEHDGEGGFSATVWPDVESKPETPNVEATGPIPESGARPLAMIVDGPSSSEFQFSHASMELSIGGATR